MPALEAKAPQAMLVVVIIGHNYYKTRAFAEYLQKMLGERAAVHDVYRTYHAADAIRQADVVIGTGWSRTKFYDGVSSFSIPVPYAARIMALLARKPYISLRRAMTSPQLVGYRLGRHGY